MGLPRRHSAALASCPMAPDWLGPQPEVGLKALRSGNELRGGLIDAGLEAITCGPPGACARAEETALKPRLESNRLVSKTIEESLKIRWRLILRFITSSSAGKEQHFHLIINHADMRDNSNHLTDLLAETRLLLLSRRIQVNRPRSERSSIGIQRHKSALRHARRGNQPPPFARVRWKRSCRVPARRRGCRETAL